MANGNKSKNIYFLGAASFFTDISSEMVFSALPLFITSVLGAGKEVLGLIEAIADSFSSLLDIFIGFASDRQESRKGFVLLGYGLSFLSKFGIALSSAWQSVLLFRASDRLGKSIRTAPRDAIIASSAKKGNLGQAFGLHRAMDTAGAIVGPAAAYLVLLHAGSGEEGLRSVLYLSLLPALLAVLIIWKFVKEKSGKARSQGFRLRPSKSAFLRKLSSLPKGFKRFLLVSCFFSLSYFSFAFMLARASELGVPAHDIMLLYAIFNVAYLLASVPAGWVSDRIGGKTAIALSFFLYALALAGFSFLSDFAHLAALFALCGIFASADESANKAYISSIAGERSAATALGAYSSAVGLFYLPANLAAGLVWSAAGAPAAFLLAALIAFASGIAMLKFA
ncbi:MAG: MFS transporter [Candidatus Micrarchaeota archaeon]|nr:MFS transporter [Candidatus Micrarchaeota archaeon]